MSLLSEYLLLHARLPCMNNWLLLYLYVFTLTCSSFFVCWDLLNLNKQLNWICGVCCCTSYVSRTHDAIDDITSSKSMSNFVTAITRPVFTVQRENIYCHNIWLTGSWHSSVGFGLKDRQRLRIEPVFGNFTIRAIDIIASFGLQIWKLNDRLSNESILTTMTSSATPQCDFEY